MRTQFPILNDCIYLNTAYVGLPSKQLMRYRTVFDNRFLEEADQFKIKGNNRLSEQCTFLASFFGAQADYTFFTPNFSVGFRFFLEFLPKSARFLTLASDYPSLENAIRGGGFSTKAIPITSSLEENIESELIQGNFDILALSMVQFTSGLEIDQSFLSDLKKRFPNLLILADGTQFLGTRHFNFNNSPFDLVVASGYKWLLAGFGNGLAFVKPNFLDFCQIQPKALEERIYAGHFDFLGAASLTFAVKQLEEWDFPALLDNKNKLTAYLKKGMRDRNLLQPLVKSRKQHASIFNFPATADFHQQLLDKGVRCSFRGTGVRLSIHFYNTTEDINRFFAIYDQLT